MSYEVKSPMPAKVLEVNVKEGDEVSEDTIVVTLESMKMEMPISAEYAGKVSTISVEDGETVPQGTTLVTID